MGRKRSRLWKLTLAVAMLGVLALALPAFASATRILYASGHNLDATRLQTFGGNTLVDPGNGHSLAHGFDGCSDSEWATALARTDYDVLMVGEDAANGCSTPLSASTLAGIANYVRSGRPIVFTAAHGDENDLLNAIFGFSTTNAAADASETLTGTLQPAASGTPFAGGVPTLHAEDLSEILGNTPGTATYSSSDGTWVFMVPFGAGTVTYLGWDYCCGSTESFKDDWYRVLDRAFKVSADFAIDSITRNKKKGTATVTVSEQFAGDLTGSGKGVKASSAGAMSSKAVGAGKAQLTIKAKGKKRKKLNQKGKVKLNVAITYTPTGGSPHTHTVKVKLKKKLRKH